ncbi:SRPBCC family protein [Nocardia sp. NPDC004123]
MRVCAFRETTLPVPVIWEVLTDHEGMSTWLPGFGAHLERPGRTVRNGVGAVRRIGLPGIGVREEITGYEPQCRLSYKALSGIPLRHYRAEVQLTGDGSHSAVTWSAMCENRSWIVEFAMRLLTRLLLGALLRTAARRAGQVRTMP